MARAPEPTGSYAAESKDFHERLAAARANKAQVEADIREAYFFTHPRLARNVLSTSAPTTAPTGDETELATDLGTECSIDFATELRSGFFPEQVNWVKSAAGEIVDEDAWKDVEEAVKERDSAIFRAIRASSFDATLATAFVPDASIGTVGLMIDDPAPSQPITCLHVPIRELEMSVGRDGRVDDRFAVRWTRAKYVRSLLRGISLPEKVAKKLVDKPEAMHAVVWSWWRDWNEPNDLVWKRCIALDGDVVSSDSARGEGSCGLIVMRFMPHALSPWGNGPTIQSLPRLRTLDALAALTQDRADVAVAPPLGFPDDGVTNFEAGIEAGKGYPMRPGSGRDVVPLYFQGDPDVGFYTLADLERGVRRAHYADYPEQRGDTPPTATQWADEMVMSQRRIGTPGVAFWREGPAEVFKRFDYLLTKRGTIAPVKINGREIALVPENPATRAQEQLEVQIAVRLLDICKSLMPDTSAAAIDELRTIENLKKGLGDKFVVLRDPAVVEGLVKNVLGGMEGGGAGAA